MSVTFDLIINPIVLLLAGVFGIFIGFAIARGKLAKVRRDIIKLEADVLACNAETLEAQRAYVELEARLHDESIPVISMKINGKDASKEKSSMEKVTK